MIFYNNRFGRLLQPFVTLYAFSSRALGWLYDTKLSKYLIKPFIRHFNIVESDFAGNPSDYRSFNDYFSRPLAPGARPIEDNEAQLVSPADSRLTIVENVSNNTQFPIKKANFNLSQFLNSEYLAKEYEGGTMFVFRLSIDDYHRFHFPTDGIVRNYDEIGGSYHTVMPGIYAQGKMPIQTNYRHIVRFTSDSYGDMLIVPVGALGVSRIVETYTPGKVNKGDEIGYFQFGGSVVVLLIKPQDAYAWAGVKLIRDASEIDKPIKMGQAVATLH